MVLFGIFLMVIGALGIAAGVLLNSGTVDFLGGEISAPAIFLVGVGSGAAVLWGFSILKYGTKRGLQHRRERKDLDELSRKLDKVEADRRQDDEDANG
ncbi:MAG: hypothetical protein V9F00_08525 [Nocardioides sp.]|jgi:membrane-bound ClpP family serine protease